MGKLIFKNKKLLTTMLFVCLGLNSQILTTLSSNDEASGSANLASSTTEEEIPEGCVYGAPVENEQAERKEKIFVSKYHPGVLDDETTEEYKYDDDDEDDEKSDTLTTRSRQRRQKAKDDAKKVKFAITYSQLLCPDEKTGETKKMDQFKVHANGVKVEADANLGDCDACLLDGAVTVKGVKNLEEVLDHLLENELGDNIKQKYVTKEFLAFQEKRVKNCEGRVLKTTNKDDTITYKFDPFSDSIKDQKKELACLTKKLRRLSETEAIELYDLRIKDELHSLSLGDKKDRIQAAALIKKIGRKRNLPIEIDSSIKSMQLYMTGINNTKEVYEPYKEQKDLLDKYACKGAFVNRPDNQCTPTISDSQYQLEVGRINATYQQQLNQVGQVFQSDTVGYNQEFNGNELAQNTVSPYVTQFQSDFDSHMQQIYDVYGGGQDVDTNPTVSSGGNGNTVLQRSFQSPAVSNSLTPQFNAPATPASLGNSRVNINRPQRK